MPISTGSPSGSGATAPKSMTAILPSGSSMKLPGGVAVHLPTRWARRRSARKPCAADVPLLLSAVADDPASGMPPSIHSLTITFGALPTTCGIRSAVALVGLGERALVVGLQPVVQFHLGAFDEFVDHALDVGAGASCLSTLVSRRMVLRSAQRLVGAGVLDLDRDGASVATPSTWPMLAEATGCRRTR